MTKLRVQGGKLCVVAGQIEQCCETPGGCFAYLSACGCVDPAGEFAVPASDVYDAVEQRYWPVYFQAATSTDPARFYVLVKVSKTLDPGITFTRFFPDGFRERCNSTDCQPGSIRLDMRTRTACPANTICFCARYGITDFSISYRYELERVVQPPVISCPTYTLNQTTDITVSGFVVYDRQTDQVIDFLVRQQINATGDEIGDIGGGCQGIVGQLTPFSSLIVSTDLARAGNYSPLTAPISVLSTGNGLFAVIDYGVVPNTQADPVLPDFPVISVNEFPCTTEFSYRVDYPLGNDLEGESYQTVDYRVSPISRYNRHVFFQDYIDTTPVTGTISNRELYRTEIRQAFRYTDNPNIDVGEGTIFDDECLPGDPPDPPNPLGNVQQGDPQGGVLPGGTGRSGADNVPRRSYPRPCLPCQQRREAGLQAALDAQRRASNCQGCGDAGLDGVL